MNRHSYSEDARLSAVRLSKEIGAKAASDRLGIPCYSIYCWRRMMKKHGRTIEPAKPTKPRAPATGTLIAEAVEQATGRPHFLQCWYGVFYGVPGIIPEKTRELVRERLRAFPDVCLRAQEAEGTMKIVLDCEIKAIKNALTDISADPLYQIVPDIYFHHLNKREVSYRANCDTVTVWHNEKRLIDELALRLYGVQAWWRVPPPTMK
jgi:hypothetical protein